jgi:hypothetical protein
MARTKPLEEDEPLNFARSVMDQIIAKHDPEAAGEERKDPKKVASGIKGGSKGGHAALKPSQPRSAKQSLKRAAKTRWSKA